MTKAHDDLPNPPVPAEADLQDFAFTPLYRARLFGSAFHAKATDSEWRAGVTLWLKAQDQSPAGSLPDDDVELARLAELGRDLRSWRKLRAGALRGWFKCNDGRLYHQVVAEVTNEQWQGKIDQRKRTLKARIAALEKRLEKASDSAAKRDIEEQLQVLRQQLSQTPATGSVTDPATASKRKGQGEGQGQGERDSSLSSVPKGTDADASPDTGDGQSGAAAPNLPATVRLADLRARNGDWAALLFGDGLDWLAQTLGRDRNKLRSAVGKWRKELANDKALFDLFAKAQADQIAQPVEWITKAIETRRDDPNTPRTHGGYGKPTSELDARMTAWLEGGRVGPMPKMTEAAA